MKTKKLLSLVIISCVISFSAYSQTEKGNFIIGGTLSVSKTTPADQGLPTIFNFSGTPSLYYFPVNKLAVGVVLPYSMSKYTYPSSLCSDASSSTFTIGPSLRYYFMLGERWAIFPQTDMSFGKTSSKNNYQPFEVTISTFKAGLGTTYFITKAVAVEGFIFYQDNSYKYDRPNIFVIGQTTGTSINFMIGFQFYLSRNSEDQATNK